jgi:hypothetical protein
MKNAILTLARIMLIGVFMLNTVTSVSAKGDVGYQTGFVRWRAAEGGFGSWARNGVILNTEGELEFDLGTAGDKVRDPYPAGGYNGGNYYNGGTFFVGEATSPEFPTTFDYKEAIASWNASTPAGSWVEVQFRAQYGTRWSKWYVLGIWAADDSTIQRHSVQSQGDSDGFVAVDTFVSSAKKATTNKLQLKLRLFSEDGVVIPTVRNASVAYSTSPPKNAVIPPNDNPRWNTRLEVPECSQMVYPDGGEVWCSPTSTSMVLGYWSGGGEDPLACETRVRAAVAGVYDWVYDGHGNWPFNTAYAAAQGYEGYVARFTSFAKAEEFVAAGVPVIISFAWDKNDLTGAAIPSSNGHLAVIVGFDAGGNPIINDPAAAMDADVERTYQRSELEQLWLQASGGTVYLIYPPDTEVPAIP